MKEQFILLPLSQQGFKIAEFLPIGKAWDAKNDSSTNLGALLLALGGEFSRIEELIQTTNREVDINFTDELLREWETSVGIPDDCFGTSEDDEARRKQIIVKLRNIRLQIVQDYKDIAFLFGVSVQVFPGVPISFVATDKEKRFSITIDIPGAFSGELFPYPNLFPIPFIKEITNLIQCLFEKIKPANVRIIFQYGLFDLSNVDIKETAILEIGQLGILFDDAVGSFDDALGMFDYF